MSYLVQWDEGNLAVEAEVCVELRGGDYEYRIDCWFLNDIEMPRTIIPEAIKQTACELAFYEYREDYS